MMPLCHKFNRRREIEKEREDEGRRGMFLSAYTYFGS